MKEFDIEGACRVSCNIYKNMHSGEWFVITETPGNSLRSEDFTNEKAAREFYDYLCNVFSSMKASVETHKQWIIERDEHLRLAELNQ